MNEQVRMEMGIGRETTIYMAIIEMDSLTRTEVDPIAKINDLFIFVQTFPFTIIKKEGEDDLNIINSIEMKIGDLLTLIKGMKSTIKVIDEKHFIGKIIKSII